MNVRASRAKGQKFSLRHLHERERERVKLRVEINLIVRESAYEIEREVILNYRSRAEVTYHQVDSLAFYRVEKSEVAFNR